MNVTGNLKHIRLLLLFAFYIYPVYIKSVEYVGYFIVYIIPLIYIIGNFKNISWVIRRCSIYQIISILGISIMAILSVVLPIVYGTQDFSYFAIVFSIVRKLIVYIFLYLLLYNDSHIKINEVNVKYMQLFVEATSLYVMITVFFVAFAPVKNLWLSIISDAGYSTLKDNYGYAMRVGWQGFSGYRNTFFCTVAVLFVLYLMNYKKENSNIYCYRTTKYYVLLIISVLGNMFYGRTGLLCSIIVLIFYMLVERMIKPSLIFKVGLILASILIVLIVLKDKSSIINDWYYWMSTPFVNLFETGKFNNYSFTNVTQKMIFLPSLNTLLWGDGRYTCENGAYYMSTDVGFMRLILFWGIGGAIFAYGTVFNSIISIGKKEKIFQIALFLIFVIYEFKGEIYFEIIPLALAMGYVNKLIKKKEKRLVSGG